jgi:serine/threonine protein kinase/tetratricopeptide (TPR) repeat protein
MKAEEIFLAAVEKSSPGERAAYLDGACGKDAALRAQVEALLKAHDGAGSFLEQPLLDPAVTKEPSDVVEKLGAVIGPYKLLEQIGEGGFGVVFMAEQIQPVRRKVALKVLKPGMDTRQVIARFEAERQALALMDHPNIAHVLDGGETASGRPYFVMELVRGIPITDFCDQNHLPVRQRLDLFVSVCQAVQHAHQKGIIHRDLKPSNVMVTLHDDKAVVKVIDFGIAKATGQQLTDKTLFTHFAQMIGTPMYMSPEQAQMSGLDVDTRTDIYSLGVLLYELLTGTTPFDQERLRKAAHDEMRRIIREEEPARPSTRISTLGLAASTVSANRASDPKHLKQLCRGELDWIAMKSLEKDRNRRYETANGLARDVERYLKDEPVLACPPTAAYRFRKFARRHKGTLTTALLLLTVLLVGTVVSTWLAVQATTAEKVATTARLAESDAKQRAQEIADKATKDLEQLNIANSLIEDGRFCVKVRAWAKAESAFTRAVNCGHDSSHVWAERADFYLQLGLWELAGSDSAKAFERREPGFIQYYFYLALLQFYSGDMNGYRQTCKLAEQRYAGSSDPYICRHLVSIYILNSQPVVDLPRLHQVMTAASHARSFPWCLDYIDMSHYRAEEYQNALDRILEAQTVARQSKPEWEPARLHATLAMIYHRQHRPERAHTELVAATEALNQRIEGMLKVRQLGALPSPYWWEILISELRYHEAKTLIDGVPPPPDPRLSHIRGRTLAAIGRHADAAASFGKALEVKPSWSEARYARADVYGRLSEWDKAAADLARAVQESPSDHSLWHCYARAKLGAGDLDGFRHACADMCERFGKTSDPTVAGHLLLVVSTIDQGVPADDLVRWSKLTAQAPSNWKRFGGYGLFRAGQYKAAVAAIQSSAKGFPLRGGDLLMLTMAEHHLGKKDDALASFEKAVKWINDTKRFAEAGGYWAWTEQVEATQLRREAAKLLGVQEND